MDKNKNTQRPETSEDQTTHNTETKNKKNR